MGKSLFALFSFFFFKKFPFILLQLRIVTFLFVYLFCFSFFFFFLPPGVMAARGLLENPALFAGYDVTPPECIADFLDISLKYGIPFSTFMHHIGKMTERLLGVYG